MPLITSLTTLSRVSGHTRRGTQVVINPAISGFTTWNFLSNGPLLINAGTEYLIVNQELVPILLNIKMWGGGSSGQGGSTTGQYLLQPSSSFRCQAGLGNSGQQGGAAASAIYNSSNSNIPIAVAGGGGGAGNVGGGAGGGLTGNGGASGNSGQGGTQSAGGAGGSSGRGAPGNPGSFRLGGDGFYNSAPLYSGSTGWAPGGLGGFKSGDGTQGGGGGGYYGGGGAGGDSFGGGGGGGSGFAGGLINGVTTTGVTSDPDRGGFGNQGQPGLIWINLAS